MTTETSFPVLFTEIDWMGIVHNSNYALWFEKGRKDYLKKAGISNTHTAMKGYHLPLSRLESTFLSPAKLGDDIIVKTKIQSMTCVKITFEYEVIEKEKGKLLARGKTDHAWTNRRVEPINIEKVSPDIYRRLREFSKTSEESLEQ